MRTILIQGAMDVEIDKLIEFYSPQKQETIAAFKTCEDFKIKRIGFRVISNNELTGEKLDKSTTKLAQDLTIKFIDKILKI